MWRWKLSDSYPCTAGGGSRLGSPKSYGRQGALQRDEFPFLTCEGRRGKIELQLAVWQWLCFDWTRPQGLSSNAPPFFVYRQLPPMLLTPALHVVVRSCPPATGQCFSQQNPVQTHRSLAEPPEQCADLALWAAGSQEKAEKQTLRTVEQWQRRKDQRGDILPKNKVQQVASTGLWNRKPSRVWACSTYTKCISVQASWVNMGAGGRCTSL